MTTHNLGEMLPTPLAPSTHTDVYGAHGKHGAQAAKTQPNNVITRRADSIEMEPVQWIWPGWLASGKVGLLAGAPGFGKTTIALRMAATVTRGGMWPDGSSAPVGNVLIWSAEDDPSDTLIPRLVAAAADLSRVHFLCGYRNTTDDVAVAFDPSVHIHALSKTIREIGAVRMVILDPVVAAVSGDANKNGDVRRGLQPLVELAADTNIAVLGITHFAKNAIERHPIDKVIGSIGFVALSRLVLVVGESADDAERVLVRAKSNIGPDGGGFQYQLVQVEVLPGINASLAEWGGFITGTSQEIIGGSASRDCPSLTQRGEIVEWLRDVINAAGGSMKVPDLELLCKEKGFSWRSVQRARSQAGIISAKSGFGSSAQVWRRKV